MKAKEKILPSLLICLVSLLLLLLLFTGCVKNQENQNLDHSDLIYCEQAYPGVTGVITKIYLGGKLVTCELINGEYIYQGDIILVPEQQPSSKAACIEDQNKRWTDNKVYYDINDNLPQVFRVTNAIKEYEDNTNLVFIQIDKNNPPPNFVEFVSGSNPETCSSDLGMIGRKQDINIGYEATTGNVIHEIGHSIGLIHEHCKSGRDNYVTILWENILVTKDGHNESHNFEEDVLSINTEGFDFESIMLYGSYSFSKNANPTITKKDRTKFGSREELSYTDIAMINRMYPPVTTPRTLTLSCDTGPEGLIPSIVAELDQPVPSEDLIAFFYFKRTATTGSPDPWMMQFPVAVDSLVICFFAGDKVASSIIAGNCGTSNTCSATYIITDAFCPDSYILSGKLWPKKFIGQSITCSFLGSHL